MSYFPYGSLEEEILADTQYHQRVKGASDAQIIRALVQVLEYFVERIDERE